VASSTLIHRRVPASEGRHFSPVTVFASAHRRHRTPLAGVAVTDIAGSDEVTSTSTAADGTYVLTGLTTGTYQIEFSLAAYDDVAVDSVSVNAGVETSNVNAAMTASAP
jgi:hypothetical protein